MSQNSPIPLEDSPEVFDTFVSALAGCGLDDGIVMVMLAQDRFRLDKTAAPFRRLCARLVMTEDTAQTLVNELQRTLTTAKSLRTQSSSPN